MGIKGLNSLLKQYCSSSIKEFKNVQSFISSEMHRLGNKEHYILGIDTFLYASKYNRVQDNIIIGFLNQTLKLLSSGILPLYIFDGNSPQSKKKTVENRKLKKFKSENKLSLILPNCDYNDLESILDHCNYLLDQLKKTHCNTDLDKLLKQSSHLDKADINNLKDFFDIMNIPYIIAMGEADDLLATLSHNNIIDACLSDDMDMLPKGCNNVIQIDSHGSVKQFLKEAILDDLQLSHSEFIDLCILLGTDYFKEYLPKHKSTFIYDIFKNNKRIEDFVIEYSKFDPEITKYVLKYVQIRSSFDISLINDENCHLYNRKTIYDKLKMAFSLPYIQYSKIQKYLKKAQITITELFLEKIVNMINIINIYEFSS